jgi:hypothetical protein
MSLKPVLMTLATLAIALVPWTLSAELELQAEDVLYCPNVEIPSSAREELLKLVSERQQLARNISAEDFSITSTPFGMRIELPEAVIVWRKSESSRVRALVSDNILHQVEMFAADVREQSSDFERKYPLRQQLGVGLTQSMGIEGGEKVLKVDLSVPASSTEYKMVHETSTEEGKLVIRVTLVRPSQHTLINKEPAPSEFKAQVTHASVPTSVEIWTRTIDETLPLSVKFTRVGEIPLSSSGS